MNPRGRLSLDQVKAAGLRAFRNTGAQSYSRYEYRPGLGVFAISRYGGEVTGMLEPTRGWQHYVGCRCALCTGDAS